MRKHALVGSLAIHASALLLLLLLGTVAHNSIRPRPAVILFEPPVRAPRPPEFDRIEGGRGRAPQPVKRRVFPPPKVAIREQLAPLVG
jgi:hypothetical protein